MKFYNIDMHISIIHDLNTIFKNLGHEIDSVCMSGHCWVNNQLPRSTDIVNRNNWLSIDQTLCDRFYERYKNDLKDVDAFVHSYPPAFALLFEKFEKPIITIACTRFEFPCSTLERSKWLVDGLKRLKNKNLLYPIANNLFDKKYCETYTGFEWEYISSLCDYIKGTYSPTTDKFVSWTRCNNIILTHKDFDSSFKISNPYNRNDLVKFKGIIHIPYNISIMSAFEQYYSNIPLFVPTVNCLKNWVKSGKNVLSELYFPGVDRPFEIKKEWLDLSDWYIDSNMPYTIKFESEEDLYDKLDNTDLTAISNKMKEFNLIRKDRIYSQWKNLLNRLK